MYYDKIWTGFTEYYRKWVLILHDWFHNYLYLPALEAGYAPYTAHAILFLGSAIVYEYIMLSQICVCVCVCVCVCGGYKRNKQTKKETKRKTQIV